MPSTDHGLADPQPQHNAVWASTSAIGTEAELTLPSGQTCRGKKMSIEAMLAAGLLTEADAITAMVSKHVSKVQGKGKKAKGRGETPAEPAVDVRSLMKDPRAITELITMLDKILPHVVVSPPVALHYIETTVGQTTVTKVIPEQSLDDQLDRIAMREDRPGLIFTDQIGLEDKMFLFDWAAGGLGTMLAFRE